MLIRNKEAKKFKEQKVKVKKIKDDGEYRIAIQNKIKDCAGDITNDNNVADIIQLLEDYARFKKVKFADFKKVKIALKKELGGFNGRNNTI